MSPLERIRAKAFSANLALNITPAEELTDAQRKYIQDHREMILAELIAEWILAKEQKQ